MLLRLLFQSNHDHFLVIDKRNNWALIYNGLDTYYLQLDNGFETHWGDLLKIEGSYRPIRMSTYEGLFHFPLYLEQRGVHQSIYVEKIEILIRFPIRFDALIAQRINQLHPNIASYVSHLLWKRPLENNVTHENIIEMMQYSGFGFYLSNQWMNKILKLTFTDKQSSIIRFVFFMPYIMMNLRQFGMLRVYGVELLTMIYPKQNKSLSKVMIMSIQSWIYPYMWLQQGTHLYLLYQFWNTFLFGLLPKLKTWKKWLGFVFIGMIYGWFYDGIIFNYLTLLFLPLSWGHSFLFPFWLIHLYAGVSIPGLTVITTLWLKLLDFFSQFNLKFYAGQVTVPIQVLFIITFVFIALSFWLQLKRYQPKLIFMSMLIGLIQMSGLENYFQTSVYFLNVGQGDATLIQSFGKSMLIDTGGVKNFDMAEEVLIPFLKKRKIRMLDYVIITHPDFDHDGALPSLLATFHVNKVIKEPFNRIQLGRLRIENYQHFHEILSEDNERSLVIGVHSLACQWLIMGDATDRTESIIQNMYPTLSAAILRIGHHGSNTSTSLDFLQQINPKEIVISVGGGNRYGHPHQEVLDRIASLKIPIRRTDIEGTIHYQTCKI